ncbi:hypothetical protein BGZ94_004318 [Podila epigama]|nr:hypothetical protein BGZ94_004318 [Podila epigama]
MSERASATVLQTPELLFRIGWFVPLWERGLFNPENIVSCIKVCRLWRNVLTPLLWMVYDGKQRRIPYEMIYANRKHIRYLNHTRYNRPNILLFTRLKGLKLRLSNASLLEELALLEANLGLLSLDLTQGSESHDLLPSLLKNLTALRCLRLLGDSEGFSVAALKSILDNSKHLGSLELGFSSTPDGDLDDWDDYPSIKRLYFQYIVSEPKLYFGLLQSCTNLEVLAITESYDPQYDCRPQLALLSRILRDQCRKVKVLWYHEQYERMPDDVLSTKDYLNVIQATSNLVRLQLSMNSFSTVICDALLHGSAYSLEILFLDIEGKSSVPESIVSAGRVLSSCPQLQRLQLLFTYYPLYSDDLEKPLIAHPWICNNLKTVTLWSIEYLSSCCESSCECKTSEEACTIGDACDAEILKQGWKVSNPRSKDHHFPWKLKEDRVVLLTAASTLPHVNTIYLGHERYEHADRLSQRFAFDANWT